MTEEKEGQESKINSIKIDSEVADNIINILRAPIIDYTEWHKNRDNMARDERNHEVHIKTTIQ